MLSRREKESVANSVNTNKEVANTVFVTPVPTAIATATFLVTVVLTEAVPATISSRLM